MFQTMAAGSHAAVGGSLFFLTESVAERLSSGRLQLVLCSGRGLILSFFVVCHHILPSLLGTLKNQRIVQQFALRQLNSNAKGVS